MILTQADTDLSGGGGFDWGALVPQLLAVFRGGTVASPTPTITPDVIATVLAQVKPQAGQAVMTPAEVQAIVRGVLADMQRGAAPPPIYTPPVDRPIVAAPAGGVSAGRGGRRRGGRGGVAVAAGRAARGGRRRVRGGGLPPPIGGWVDADSVADALGAAAPGFFSEHKTGLLIGGGVLAAALAGYLVYRKVKRPSFGSYFARTLAYRRR